jgi:type VI secretion system secreted protein VgrG
MATTQNDRLMQITTPLGPDFLLLNRFDAVEGISKLFSIEAELLHEETTADFDPTVVDPQALLGRSVTISIKSTDGASREFSGIVNQFTQGNRDARFSYYRVSIVPHVWLLTQSSQSRIFQQMSVPDILKKVFAGFEFKFVTQAKYEPRNYCVQYRETDFDFASRLMEEEGIFYYFEHAEGKHKIVFGDSQQAHPDCPGNSEVPFFVNVGDPDDFVSSVNTFLGGYRVQTGKVTLWDYNFQLPTNHLINEQSSVFSYGDNQKLEVYDYPGGYARKYDGISKSGGEQSGELQKVFEDGKGTAKDVLEALDSTCNTISALSDWCGLTAGHRFTLSKHPNSELNGKYTITNATHSAEQNPSYSSAEAIPEPYRNRFTCIPQGAGKPGFVPQLVTPKPIVHGSQTAFVVGPSGEEIYTDKFGRVKVQFHWDRDGQVNEGSSCWIRVAQTWSGNKWGSMFIPRVGMEVIVHFLEGDPDRPIITGCVPNPQTMPPYTLPDEKTKSTIKSNSTKGGGGFNEFRFEDKKGSEQIFIHAEKDQDLRVKNDCKEIIIRDRHLIVERDQFEKVKKDKHLQVAGDQIEKVGGNMHLNVSSNKEQKIGSKFAVDSGQEIHLKAGMSVTIEAGTQITLKAAGNFINIGPSGVSIKGTMVMINSGGAAGSGAGASPSNPKDPLEADKAEPGQAIKITPAPPPKQPAALTPLLAAARNPSSPPIDEIIRPPFDARRAPVPQSEEAKDAAPPPNQSVMSYDEIKAKVEEVSKKMADRARVRTHFEDDLRSFVFQGVAERGGTGVVKSMDRAEVERRIDRAMIGEGLTEQYEAIKKEQEARLRADAEATVEATQSAYVEEAKDPVQNYQPFSELSPQAVDSVRAAQDGVPYQLAESPSGDEAKAAYQMFDPSMF